MLPISLGSGATVATEQINGAHYGYNKIVGGQSGATIGWQINTDGSGQMALEGNVTLADSKGFIGLTSVSGFTNPLPVSFSGNVTLDAGSKTGIVGNVTISDSKGYIGLVTTSPGSAWPDPKGYIGLVSVAQPLTTTFGNVTISDSKGYIGLVTTTFAPFPVLGGSAPAAMFLSTASGSPMMSVITDSTGHSANVEVSGALDVQSVDSKGYIGLVTANNVAWVDPKTYIGLVTATLGAGLAGVGFATVNVSNLARTITGNMTLTDSKGFIGLVTVNPHAILGNVTLSDPKTFIGSVTVGGYMGWTYSFISNSSGAIVKSGTGMLHAIVVGMPSLASCVIYDQTTPATPILGTLAQGINPGTYYYDCLFANGLTISLASTAVLPQLTVMYK